MLTAPEVFMTEIAMRRVLIVLCSVLMTATTATAQISLRIDSVRYGVSLGIDLPAYPRLTLVPGYPVYYAPQLAHNYFFYDGHYWVYQRDNWYVSAWYNGPWALVDRRYVPLYVLRIPVRYYLAPPSYFRGWTPDGPPRWGERWGASWEQQRRGWEQWDRRAVPSPAPLPQYQQRYSGGRYPSEDRQQQLHRENYHYEPREIRLQHPAKPAPRSGQDQPGRNNKRPHNK